MKNSIPGSWHTHRFRPLLAWVLMVLCVCECLDCSKDCASYFSRHWTTASRRCHTGWNLCCLALSIIFCSPFAEIKDKLGFWQNSPKPETFTCVVWWLVCRKHREWAELKCLNFSEGFDSVCSSHHPIIFNGASKDTARSWHCSYTVERRNKQQVVDQVVVNIEIKHQWQLDDKRFRGIF